MMRNASLARCAPGLVLLLVLVAGCRTYGGHGAEEEMPRQMQQAVQQFASELDRARSDAKALAETASQDEAIDVLEAQYRNVIERHEELLDQHRRMAERFQDGGSYRDLHRNYGAMISEQRLVRKLYEEMHTRIYRARSGEAAVAGALPASRYVVNPLYYERVENLRTLTMRQALQGG